MLKLIRAVLFLLGLLLVVMLSISNREPVEVSFWPLPSTTSVPLYWILLFGLFIGAVLGGLATWISGFTRRRAARVAHGKVRVMEQRDRQNRDAEERAAVEEARRKTQALALTPPRAVLIP